MQGGDSRTFMNKLQILHMGWKNAEELEHENDDGIKE